MIIMVRHKRINEPDIRYDGQNLFQLNATPDLPKYTSGFINDVNGWAGGTKPENVGQASELIKRFREEHPQGTLEDWKTFHHTLTDIQVLKGRGNTKRFENVHMIPKT